MLWSKGFDAVALPSDLTALFFCYVWLASNKPLAVGTWIGLGGRNPTAVIYALDQLTVTYRVSLARLTVLS